MLVNVRRVASSKMLCKNITTLNSFEKYPFLSKLGLKDTNLGCWNGKAWVGNGATYTSVSPATNEKIACVKFGNAGDYDDCLKNMQEAQNSWMMLPAPKRGEIVRQIGMKLRQHQDSLGSLVSLEMGKIKSEGLGEVQEFIDMCDLAVGMSRQIPGNVNLYFCHQIEIYLTPPVPSIIYFFFFFCLFLAFFLCHSLPTVLSNLLLYRSNASQRARGPRVGGGVEPAGQGRYHLSLQLPQRRARVEHSRQHDLREHTDMEGGS